MHIIRLIKILFKSIMNIMGTMTIMAIMDITDIMDTMGITGTMDIIEGMIMYCLWKYRFFIFWNTPSIIWLVCFPYYNITYWETIWVHIQCNLSLTAEASKRVVYLLFRSTRVPHQMERVFNIRFYMGTNEKPHLCQANDHWLWWEIRLVKLIKEATS